MSADLHCHTIVSDGSVAIDELILLARNKGLKTISLTDHDTFSGVTRAKIFGEKHGIDVIDGVEISAFDYDRNKKVHILAYMCEYPNRLVGMLRKVSDSRRAAMNISIQKVIRLYPIPVDMILRRAHGGTNIYKQHVMQALMDAGYCGCIYGDVYRKLFDPRIGLAKTKCEYPDVRDVINLVHDAGGVAVLAHPAVYDSYDLLTELAESGEIDGFERKYPRAIAEDDKMLSEIGKNYKLIMTGGSDFHGANTGKPCHIGTSVCADTVIGELKKRRQKYINAK